MLTVWTVCNGDKYTDADVLIVRDMVERNLSHPHRFKCLSDRRIPGVECLVPEEDWPGWWAKLLLFRYADGAVLYLDLDVVVVGPLDRCLSRRLSMPANWAQSGHGGCQSSVMSWDSRAENVGYIADRFDIDQVHAPERGNCGAYGPKKLWGDQEYITAMLGNPGGAIVPMNHIYSYKYHCRDKPPEDASVVCFHGDPKPAQVNAKWIQAARLSTAIAV